MRGCMSPMRTRRKKRFTRSDWPRQQRKMCRRIQHLAYCWPKPPRPRPIPSTDSCSTKPSRHSDRPFDSLFKPQVRHSHFPILSGLDQVAFSADLGHIAVARSGKMTVWNLSSEPHELCPAFETGQPAVVAFSADSKRLGIRNLSEKVWDLSSCTTTPAGDLHDFVFDRGLT